MGSRVGPYVLTDKLGKGTYGDVRLATHRETKMQYAIKVLDKRHIEEHGQARHLRSEISVMRTLKHRNIVSLHEVLASKSKVYLVMELVRGGELFSQLEDGALEKSKGRFYFQQLVDGIKYCHDHGVYHRDLKPENLLLCEDSTLKISDFGFSSMNNEELLFTACGTPFYCAPEIIDDAKEGYSGAKVDAWSCGIILYLIVTGKLPFYSEDIPTLFQQITRCLVLYPSDMEDNVKDLIGHLLEKDPNKRYSIDDVMRHPWFLVDYNKQEHGGAELSATTVEKERKPLVDVTSAENIPKLRRRPSTKEERSTSMYSETSVETLGSRQEDDTSDGTVSRSKSQHAKDTSSDAKQVALSTSTTEKERANQADPSRSAKPACTAASPSSNTMKPKNLSAFKGKELNLLITNALSGKSAKHITKVMEGLAEADIDCVEDIIFILGSYKTPHSLAAWLEKQCQLPGLTSMRLASFFFE